MNIKDAIDKGLYPKDEKGRALVRTVGGDTVAIYATDSPGEWPIVGHDGDSVESWRPDGTYNESHGAGGLRLLPPPPRKVEVKAWARYRKTDMPGYELTYLGVTSRKPDLGYAPGEFLVELTGSYEEPWLK